jgi:hypothetical protein
MDLVSDEYKNRWVLRKLSSVVIKLGLFELIFILNKNTGLIFFFPVPIFCAF